MAKKLIFVLILGLLLALGPGCSKKSTNTDLTEGNSNDPTFLQAQEVVDGYLGSQMFPSLLTALEYLNYTGPMAKPAVDTSFWDFDASTYWHVYFEANVADSPSYYFVGIDSFRFQAGDDYQEYPDSATDAFSSRIRMDGGQVEGDTSIGLAYRHSYDITGMQSEAIVVTGSTFGGVFAEAGNVLVSDTITGTMTNITIPIPDSDNVANVHPVAGSVAMTVAVRSTQQIGDMPAMNIHWSLAMTFSTAGCHIRVESDENYWEWDETWETMPPPNPNPYPWH